MTTTATRPPASPRSPKSRQTTRRSSLGRSRRREAIGLVIPSLIPILIFSVAPLLNGIYLAFTDATLRRDSDNAFIGLENFGRLASDDLFWNSFKIGMIWAVSVTVLQLVTGMGLALLLNTELRFKSLTRVLALIPWAMPPVVVAIMWMMIYSPSSGPLNATLGFLGGPSDINWLGNFSTALPAVIVVGVWVGMPQTTVILLAGLQQIAPELHEAAAVDGANAWVSFWKISLPCMAPIVASIGSLNLIWNFNSFGLVYVMTEGGPGGQTMLPMLFTYLEAFKNRNIGYAAAMGDVLVIIIVVLLGGYLWSQFRKESEK